jgi:hypothetical protein
MTNKKLIYGILIVVLVIAGAVYLSLTNEQSINIPSDTGTSIETGNGSETNSSCAQAGEMCGSIAGIICCKELTCEYEGDYPDASGTCVE